MAVEQEDLDPTDLTETTVTTEEENDRSEADLELRGPTEETGRTALVT